MSITKSVWEHYIRSTNKDKEDVSGIFRRVIHNFRKSIDIRVRKAKARLEKKDDKDDDLKSDSLTQREHGIVEEDSLDHHPLSV